MGTTFAGLSGFQWAILGAAIAVIGGGIGSSMGITYIANVAAGILTEDPSKFGALLPIIAVPGTQGVYGFITGVLVMTVMKPGGGWGVLEGFQGFYIFLACLPVAFNCMISAIYQGLTSVGAAGMVAKRTEEAGKALILPALVETYAVLSLITTIIMLVVAVRPTISG